ncbi:hypothetical protein B0H15DRAFT_836349 [Mycena belliarum]|uniref:Uncharacterized protein n=1 Tax=Mycena belliarum TaxID=1033014 RepID=A0AAD6UAD8_9AGAR|nr:hypothetical protein B0H15DRAFT_836349 [Mycena belliae]
MHFPRGHLFSVLVFVTMITAANEASHCKPTFCDGTEFVSEEFLCGDPRLGPKHLPSSPPFRSLLSGYQRLGGFCPAAFLQKWFNSSESSYLAPPATGFQLSTAHTPIAGDQVLARGVLVDCFGTLYETFLGAAATGERAAQTAGRGLCARTALRVRGHPVRTRGAWSAQFGRRART